MIHSITDFEGTRGATGVNAGSVPTDDAESLEGDGRRETESTGDRTPGTADGGRSTRTVLGYALLFSLPVGVGVAVMLLRVTGNRPTDAVVFAPSVAFAAAVFLLVVGIGSGGSAEP